MRASNALGLALQAITRVEKQIELEARLLGELDEGVKVAVGFAPPEPEPEAYNLSLLTDEELDEFIRILRKSRAMVNGVPVAGTPIVISVTDDERTIGERLEDAGRRATFSQ